MTEVIIVSCDNCLYQERRENDVGVFPPNFFHPIVYKGKKFHLCDDCLLKAFEGALE